MMTTVPIFPKNGKIFPPKSENIIYLLVMTGVRGFEMEWNNVRAMVVLVSDEIT